MLLFSLIYACAQPEETPPESTLSVCSEGGELSYVLNHIEYARRHDGVAWGFNIDGLDSDDQDDDGCNKEDLVDPLGNSGIDNALSSLIPALDMTEASAVEGLIQDSINTGELLMMLRLSGLDTSPSSPDLYSDECISLEFLRAAGTPMVGTDGTILDSQSFTRSEFPSVTQETVMSEGALMIDGIPIGLEIQVLDKYLTFEMFPGGVYAQILPDGTVEGFFGGSLPIDYLFEIAAFDEVGITDLLNDLLSTAADLNPDETGQCQNISVAFEFTAIPGYLYTSEEQ